MSLPRRSLIARGIASIAAASVLWFIQFFAMWLESSGAAVVLLVAGSSTFFLPFGTFRKARGTGAQALQMMGAWVGAVALVAQVWLIMSVTGRCGLLDGC